MSIAQSVRQQNNGLKQERKAAQERSPRKFLLVLASIAGVIAPTWGQTISSVELATMYLKNAQKADGLFRFEYDFLTNTHSSRNNIVRQTGAGYALAEYFLFSKDKNFKESILKALRAYSASQLGIEKENWYQQMIR